MKNKEYIKTDVVIVGSGVAGLFAALCLPKDKDVLIITKENTNECDSMLAQGGVCVLKDVNDFKCYFEDTMKAGHWENDPDSVKVMIESSQEVIGTLIDLGVKFDTDKNGEYDYTREGAHRRNRILHHKDETGKEITATLLDIAKQKENITIVPRTTMIDFIEKDNVCQGIVCEDEYGEMGSIIARDIILATGGPGMGKAAYSSGKPALGVGAGNTPAIIDESADILKAVNSIIHSKTFDNGMICASEQSTIVDKKIYKEVRKEFEYRGCYFLKKDELDKVRKTIIINGALNAKIVGQKPVTIAALAGVKIPEDTKVLIGEVESVDLSEEFAHEKLSPVLAMYKSENFEDALAKAEKLIADGGYGHTSSIYINELTEKEKLAEFEARMKTCRVLVNTPSSFGGEWWVPEKYVDRLGGADFRKLIFIDRTNQNLATLEQGDSTWLVRSMNPITTGLHRPPYKRETPPGVYVIRRKLEAMPFLRDGSIEPGGFAPWASRFSGGAYLHGVPVNYPDSVVLEYSGTLGTTPRSHMCVRNATSHAKFIYDWAPISEALVIVFD